MSISIKQLQQLADYFHFDINEARAVIGMELKKRAASASPPSSARSSMVSGHYQPRSSTGTKAKKPAETKESTEAKKRGPSGYNLFVSGSGLGIQKAGPAWKALSEAERAKWNAKAKAA